MRALVISQSITNRTTVLDKYLTDLSSIPLLSADDETILSRQIRAGDRAAVDKLVKSNLRFVVSVAKKYQNQGMSLEDLICEGNLGLIKAAERFDATKGFKFISFAVWWIRQAIMHALSEKRRMIRLPANQINEMNKIRSTAIDIEQRLERQPTTDELAELLEIPLERIREYEQVTSRMMSLDKESGDDDDFTLKDVLADTSCPATDQGLMAESFKLETAQLLSFLKKRDRMVIELYFGLTGEDPKSLEEIATFLKMSKERIRQIKNTTLQALRERLERQILKV